MKTSKNKQDSNVIRILFICLGNICRSPMAEGCLRKRVEENNYQDRILIDSAATSNYNVGSRVDDRALSCALMQQIDLSSIRARQITTQDCEIFDYLICMDKNNLSDVKKLTSKNNLSKLRLMMSFTENQNIEDVPDPYFSNMEEFKHVFKLLNEACDALFEEIKQ